MTDTLALWRKLLTTTLGVVAAGLLLVMMLVTSVDVIGRYVFNRPLTGAFELTELLLAALIFIGLPLATERDEHITVDLLDAFLPHGVIRWQVMAMSALSAVVLAVLAWQLWLKADSLALDGNITNTLELPLAPIGYLMAGSCALTAVILLVQGLLAARRVFGRENNKTGAE